MQEKERGPEQCGEKPRTGAKKRPRPRVKRATKIRQADQFQQMDGAESTYFKKA